MRTTPREPEGICGRRRSAWTDGSAPARDYGLRVPLGRAHVTRCVASLAVLGLAACAGGGDPRAVPTSDTAVQTGAAVTTNGALAMDEDGFWRVVEDARQATDGDPYAMAEWLQAGLADADSETLRTFQEQLVAASTRLYTWRHQAAAEMVCGFASADVFTDWRSWVVTLGRDRFTRVAENPDALADVDDLSGGCDAGGEFFGAAVSSLYYTRHGFEGDFPLLETVEAPAGEPYADAAAARAALPNLSARIPDDGLGAGPRTFPHD